MNQSRTDLLKITQVVDVQLEKAQQVYTGTLHLTLHNLIFNYPEGELWIPYPIIHTVERRPPSLQSGRHPLYIRCRDFLIVTLSMLKEGEAQDVFDSVQKLTCVSSTEQLYAYSYQPQPPFKFKDGWKIYDSIAEYERMGVTATITRSSQPMVGFKQARSIQDEKLIEAIFATNVPSGPNGQTVYGSTAANLIVDARPMANAMGNVARGAGTENMENYRNCKKVYIAIDNIHVMRDSLAKMSEAMQGADTGGIVNRTALQRSNWLKHIGILMDGTLTIVKNIHVYSSHVLIHCSDGWDRTAQLVSISELCLDPYYRTFKGFQVLIEKEWISFGHKFADRCGHLSNEKYFVNLAHTGNAATNTIKDMQNKFYKSNYYQRETSPVFHQFLDCVFQLLKQFPTRFEFNERMLIDLHYHVYSCQFGTFLFNCEAERKHYQPYDKTTSIWDYFAEYRDRFINENYDPNKDEDLVDGGSVLFPNAEKIQYWAGLFNRKDEEVNEAIVYGTQQSYGE
ncbi:hypothetical protein EC973_006259 [Apophysomyces ossiformis]|uniref:Myotubularin phosphatase domain-containing protein n=1 Tax=Apophysomyces ossiformis TaxID=679940 RepID=A0A8H7ESE8_9FUNG|nr:hypothetical protein EC973_006259 [Apophysomyces ossiformis]